MSRIRSRSILGDCIEKMKAIPDSSIDAVICDPPYGITACKWDSVIPLEPMWEQLKRIVKENGAILLFGAQPFSSALVMSNPKLFKYEWVWEKNVPTGHLNAKKMPMKWHEQILCFYSKLPTYNPQFRNGPGYKVKLSDVHSENYGSQRNVGVSENDGTHYLPKDIIQFNNENSKGKLHPTQKPVALMEYFVKAYTKIGRAHV